MGLGLLATWTGNYTASKIGREYYEKQDCKTDIFDVGYALVPQYDVPWYVYQGYTALWFPFLLTIPGPLALKISYAVSIRLIALLALRAITTVVTVLPKEETCDSSKFSFAMLFSGQCYDKVFSGHTALAVLVSLAFVSNGVWPVWGGWMYSIGMALMLLVTRGHYTIDIVLGAAFAYLSWHCDLPWMKG
jgi:hypothetical protein